MKKVILIGFVITFYSFIVQQINFPASEGIISESQLNTYYPNVLDTVKDKRIIVAIPLKIKKDSIIVSILNNTATFEQMFLCTHNLNHKLIDTYYIGKSIMWDGHSHVINYSIVGDTSLHFHHVDYGNILKDGNYEIDTVKHWEYDLSFSNKGSIIKK